MSALTGMDTLTIWLPLALGGVVIVAICYKVFKDPNVNNYLGYALLVGLALCALPTLQHFTYKGSIGEISADMKGAVLNQSASLGADIDSISKKVDTIITTLNATQALKSQITPQYQQNKSNEVLVYFAEAAQKQAQQIRDFLLGAGYKSSATLTDFSELSPPLPTAGSVRLVYTTQDTDLANTVRAQLRQKFPQLNQLEDDVVQKMKTGDLQLQLF
jgi:hypothetical protein